MAALLNRLRERKMAQWAIAYAAAAWVLLQVLGLAADSFEWPRAVMRIGFGAILVGFVATLVLAWYHGEHGQQRVSGTELLILALLLTVGGGVLWRIERGSSPHPADKEKLAAQEQPAAARELNRKSIAVLPFANLSSDKDNAYFADGIQDEILTRLAKIGDLKVISRTSTLRYASKPDNLQAIAAELGVAHIVEGSVQKVGDSVRINVQLINAASDTHLWAEIYDRKLVDVFGIQSEVAAAIAQALQATLTTAERQQLARRQTSNPAAYDAYLKGLSVAGRANYSTELHAQARDHFAEAARLDPAFVEAWAHLVETQSFLYFNLVEHTPAALAKMKAAAESAIRLRPDGGEAWMAVGYYRYRGLRDFPGAVEAFERAEKLLPNDAQVLGALGSVERRQTRLPAALAHIERASQLDPGAATWPAMIGEMLAAQRRFPEARAAYDRALAVSPEDVDYFKYKVGTFLAEGDLDAAGRLLATMPTPHDGEPVDDSARDYYLKLRRDHGARLARARAALEQAPAGKKGAVPRMVARLRIADTLADQGDDAGARAEFARVLAELDTIRDNGTDDDQLSDMYALVHFGLGDARTALADIDRAIAYHQGDAKQTPDLLEAKAWILAGTGRKDEAIALLRTLLEVPYGPTPALLRLNPSWDVLRDDPRFRQLSGAG